MKLACDRNRAICWRYMHWGGRPLLLSTDPDDLPHPPRPIRLFKVASI